LLSAQVTDVHPQAKSEWPRPEVTGCSAEVDEITVTVEAERLIGYSGSERCVTD
jgi:hypothetical protein